MKFADPRKNIAQFGLGEGKLVADLGAGSGFYAVEAARMVGTTGRVYAVEVQKELVARVQELAKTEGLGNIEVLWGDIEEEGGTKLKEGIMDAVILSNILFQVEDKMGLVREAGRILKPKGRILVVDWEDSFGGMGPEPDAIITAKDARALFENNGYIYEHEINAGAHHYGFSMSKI